MSVSLDPVFVSRFDGQTKLLVQSLLSGASGSRRALCVFQRQQRSNPQLSLHSFINTLCQEEICTETDTQTLAVKPLVCLFPASFKQNLLSFIHLVGSALPRTGVLHLLQCLGRDPCPNPWVSALVQQLERDLGAPGEKPLYSALCSQKLNALSGRLVGAGQPGGWAECFSGRKAASQGTSGLLGTQRKRKSSFLALDSDAEETKQQSKRMKVDSTPVEEVGEHHAVVELGVSEETSGRLCDVHTEVSVEELKPADDDLCDALSEHMKISFFPVCLRAMDVGRRLPSTYQASIPQIKELLESQTEWDQSATDVFKVLNDCDPAQVEVLCSMLSLPNIPEQTLPKLCSSLLALSPELSYSAAATLIKSLLLGKVRSLSEPASRCLVTAATSLCSRYPRPTCHALIGPVLQERNIGNPQAELLNRLIGDCLEPHYRLLLLQMTFKIAWNEAVLSIIHSLLDSKPELNEELFTHFTEHLVSQAPQFTKSMKFAKMMLTVLTKYNSHVTAAHKHSMSSCLALNETFLKKSLQAALKRITHT